jgi:hypothetical protein
MAFLAQKSCIRTVKQDDPLFTFTDGIVAGRRAGFEISGSCPEGHRAAIIDSINHGWLKPVAFMRDTEVTFELLSK